MPYLRNKRTGETVWVDPPQGGVGPAAPDFPFKGPQAGANVNKTVADTEKTMGDITKQQREIAQNPVSADDQKFINEMRTGTGDMTTLIRDITAAQQSVDRFKPSPDRGSYFNNVVPDDDDGWISLIGKKLGRGMASITGNGISDQEIEDFQRLKGLQEARVLQQAQAQKGPQTESDALRMKLADISPSKSVNVNAQILAETQYDAMMNQQEPEFYAKWANKYGSTNSQNPEGRTAGEVWADHYAQGLEAMRSDPRYKRVAEPKTQTADDGWQIEEVD